MSADALLWSMLATGTALVGVMSLHLFRALNERYEVGPVDALVVIWVTVFAVFALLGTLFVLVVGGAY